MARKVGVNLTGAVIDGWLTRVELAGMVDRCLRCGHVPACTAFLTQEVQALSPPAFCDNKPGLEALTLAP